MKYQVEQMACLKGLGMVHQVAKPALEQLHLVKMVGYLVPFEEQG